MKSSAPFLTALIVISSFHFVPLVVSPTSTPFSHVVVITQENHSFDNYFGTYPTANGTLTDSITRTLTRVRGIPDHVCLAYSNSCVSPRLSTSPSPESPQEGQVTYENDYGQSSNFATSSGPQSMVYFDYHSVPGYWDYAEEYGLADNYYSAVLSMTTPNRLMLLTGDTPVSENYGPPPFVTYGRTIFGQLDESGVSWGYYDLLDPSKDPAQFYPLNYITGLAALSSNVRNLSSLFIELSSGTGFPSVAYVSFLGNLTLTEHPPFSPVVGESQTISIVNAIMKSSYWNSTVIFMTWDEGGGFYDHVQPPKDFSLDGGFAHKLKGLGQRVPLIVISPYSKLNYVSDMELSHLSLLHFIEYNWNLAPINNLVAESNLPLGFFDFSQTPRTKLILGLSPSAGLSYPLPLQSIPRSSTAGNGTLVDIALMLGPFMAIVAVVAVTFLFVWRSAKGSSKTGN